MMTPAVTAVVLIALGLTAAVQAQWREPRCLPPQDCEREHNGQDAYER